jgi:hypothetical protein
MLAVPRELVEHVLEVSKTMRPIKQKLLRFVKDRKEAIEVEVCKLLAVGFIRECKHTVWLTNPILVPKKTGGLRMCIEYTHINKHDLTDPFPLPRIDQVVDSLKAHPGSCRSTTVAKNIVFKAQVWIAKSRWHSTHSSLPIRQVCSLLPVLINSIRLLPHAFWHSIMFFHVWVIVDLLYPIARVCSKSFYYFVEICR